MTKISDLTALTGAAVDDAADLFPIVDMSEAGTARNKKITIDETRIALGLSSADSPQFTALNLGHASDTTITRVSAGVVAIEGVNIVTTAGGITFAADISVPDEAYGVGWNGSLEAPTKNALYDKIETLGAGSITELDDVPDVNAPTPSNGDVLTWDSTPGEWVSAAPSGGSNALDDLTDVDAPTPSDGDVLTFDSGSGDWINAAPAGGSVLRALVKKSADATGTDLTTNPLVSWDSTIYDTGNFHPVASTVTITIATPGVVTWTGHNFLAGSPIVLTTTGALPTGLTAGTIYYVVSPAANTFQLSATSGGAAINTTGSQSGVHTATNYSRLTIPTGSGITCVEVTCQMRIESVTSSAQVFIILFKNGSTSFDGAAGSNITPPTNVNLNFTVTLPVAEGDYLEVQHGVATDNSVNVIAARSSFGIKEVP